MFANIEKASPSVLEMIVSILHEGIFKNREGMLVDLTAVLVLMKSNAGHDVYLQPCRCLDNVWKVKQIISGHQQLQVEHKYQCYYKPFLEKVSLCSLFKFYLLCFTFKFCALVLKRGKIFQSCVPKLKKWFCFLCRQTSKNFSSEFLDHLDEVLVLPHPSPLQFSEITRIQLRKLIPEMLSPMRKKVIVYLSQDALLLDLIALMDVSAYALPCLVLSYFLQFFVHIPLVQISMAHIASHVRV